MTGTVPRIRMYVTLAIRLLAVAMLLVGTYGLVQATLQFTQYGTFHIEYDEGFTWIGYGLGYIVGGAGLALLSGPMVRWLVPVRLNECPQCGYGLKNLKSPTCPECGHKTGE